MDAIAVSMLAEPAATKIPSGESSSPEGSLFGSLVSAAAKDEEQGSERFTDAPVDPTALVQLDAMPPFLVRQWLMQGDLPISPKGSLPEVESLPAYEHDPAVPEAETTPSSEIEEPAQNEPDDLRTSPSRRDTLLVARETVAGNGPLQSVADWISHPLPSQRGVAPTAPSSADVDVSAAQPPSDHGSDATVALTALPSRVDRPAIARATSEYRGKTPFESQSPDVASDETAAHSETKTPQSAEAPKPAPHAPTSPALQRAPDFFPQFAANAQPNASTPDGAGASPQPWTISVAAASSAEAPQRLALAPRSDPAVEMQALALHIAARSARGDSRFTIRLDPPELGRIEVNLNVTNHGHAQAVLAVEKPQTLELLLRDASTLERALKDAGLDVGGNLSFSLKEEGRPQFAREDDYAPPRKTLELVSAENTNTRSAQHAALHDHLYGLRTARLDITV